MGRIHEEDDEDRMSPEEEAYMEIVDGLHSVAELLRNAQRLHMKDREHRAGIPSDEVRGIYATCIDLLRLQIKRWDAAR